MPTITSTRRASAMRRRAATAAALAVAAASLVPATAGAATATSGSATFTQRTSWINYLTGTAFYQARGSWSVGGTGVSKSGTYGVAYGSTAFSSGSTTYNLASASTGSGTVALNGSIDYRSTPHAIEIDIDNPQITLSSPTSTTATLSFYATYDPIELNWLGLPGTQVDNNVPWARVNFGTVNLSGKFTGTATTHTWTNAPIALTADGAELFNGGEEQGNYAAGDEFGSISFTASS